MEVYSPKLLKFLNIVILLISEYDIIAARYLHKWEIINSGVGFRDDVIYDLTDPLNEICFNIYNSAGQSFQLVIGYFHPDDINAEIVTRHIPSQSGVFLTVAAGNGCDAMLRECSVTVKEPKESAETYTYWAIHCSCFPHCDKIIMKFHVLPALVSPKLCRIRFKVYYY